MNRRQYLWSLVAVVPLAGLGAWQGWHLNANAESSAKTVDCCADPTCYPGCCPECPPDCCSANAAAKTATECCVTASTECCVTASESADVKSVEKGAICPPCPFCP